MELVLNHYKMHERMRDILPTVNIVKFDLMSNSGSLFIRVDLILDICQVSKFAFSFLKLYIPYEENQPSALRGCAPRIVG